MKMWVELATALFWLGFTLDCGMETTLIDDCESLGEESFLYRLE
jgi:hypothetical protein